MFCLRNNVNISFLFKINLHVVILRVPDTPCISQTLSVTFSDSHTQSVIDAISTIGDVSMTGSLQIAELLEQPGAILVQWYDEVLVLDFVLYS